MVGTLLCVYVQPPARGSGIAEIKAFLNGVAIPGLFQLRTLLIKLIAVICAVGGGLCVGQEGPMIRISIPFIPLTCRIYRCHDWIQFESNEIFLHPADISSIQKVPERSR